MPAGAAIAAQPIGLVRARRGELITDAGGMLAAFAVCATALAVVLAADWGIRGVWGAICLLILVRLVLMGMRFLRRRWLVTGWA